jgi:transglutaminase-like putative cysteine protease
MENAVSAVDSPSGGVPGEFYGTELQLGRGFPLSEAIMFEVRVPELPNEEKPPRYYWRGRTYDFFTGGQWYITGTSRSDFSPQGNGPALPNTEERDPQKFTFKVGESRFSLLYGPSEPVWYSRPGSYLSAPAAQEKDVVTWNASPSLLPGEMYEVQAVIKNPNTTELRQAGTDYPEWVTEKYLQLPDNFSPRIVSVAKDITSNTDNPYDKTMAITRYLRENIKYAPTVPNPPRNRDALDWVLFEHKQAYCVYYASAEVLMLRSIGIPARMAAGFAQGAPTEIKNDIADVNIVLDNSFTVRKVNAHAWPEVYFPGIGWIEFEPTANQSALNRPAAPDPTSVGITPPVDDRGPLEERDLREEDPTEGPQQPLTPTRRINPLYFLVPLFIAAAALAFFLGRRYNIPARVPVLVRASFERSGARVPSWVVRWEQWTFLSPIAKAFQSINFALRLLKQPVPLHSTPSERADALAKLLPQVAEPIKILLDEHQTSLYTSRAADVNRARRSAMDIRLQAIIALLRHFMVGEYAVRS